MKRALFISLAVLPLRAATAQTARVVSAADAFLETLKPAQRQTVLFAFGDWKQRANGADGRARGRAR
jgi:hypothetical protein